MKRCVLWVLMVWTAVCLADFSSTDKRNLLTALDNPSGVTILGGKYTIFNMDPYGSLDYENPIKSVTEKNMWVVQKDTEDGVFGTRPLVGGSCIRSNLGTGSKDYDARQLSLTFQVTGPGVFSFYYKTSTWSAHSSGSTKYQPPAML